MRWPPSGIWYTAKFERGKTNSGSSPSPTKAQAQRHIDWKDAGVIHTAKPRGLDPIPNLCCAVEQGEHVKTPEKKKKNLKQFLFPKP